MSLQAADHDTWVTVLLAMAANLAIAAAKTGADRFSRTGVRGSPLGR